MILSEAELTELETRVTAALGGLDVEVVTANDEVTVNIPGEAIVEVLTRLRDEPACLFKCFIDIAGVDWPGREQRFDVVYHLLSPRHNRRVRIKLRADEVVPVPSVVGVFPAAEWYEREAYDLFGVLFSGHPDLRRILTDYGFEGHPLRKDFPLSGFVEVRYDEAERRVVNEPARLPQDWRMFDFVSPWEGMDDPIHRDAGTGPRPIPALPGDEKATRN